MTNPPVLKLENQKESSPLELQEEFKNKAVQLFDSESARPIDFITDLSQMMTNHIRWDFVVGRLDSNNNERDQFFHRMFYLMDFLKAADAAGLGK